MQNLANVSALNKIFWGANLQGRVIGATEKVDDQLITTQEDPVCTSMHDHSLAADFHIRLYTTRMRDIVVLLEESRKIIVTVPESVADESLSPTVLSPKQRRAACQTTPVTTWRSPIRHRRKPGRAQRAGGVPRRKGLCWQEDLGLGREQGMRWTRLR